MYISLYIYIFILHMHGFSGKMGQPSGDLNGFRHDMGPYSGRERLVFEVDL